MTLRLNSEGSSCHAEISIHEMDVKRLASIINQMNIKHNFSVDGDDIFIKYLLK